MRTEVGREGDWLAGCVCGAGSGPRGCSGPVGMCPGQVQRINVPPFSSSCARLFPQRRIAVPSRGVLLTQNEQGSLTDTSADGLSSADAFQSVRTYEQFLTLNSILA